MVHSLTKLIFAALSSSVKKRLLLCFGLELSCKYRVSSSSSKITLTLAKKESFFCDLQLPPIWFLISQDEKEKWYELRKKDISSLANGWKGHVEGDCLCYAHSYIQLAKPSMLDFVQPRIHILILQMSAPTVLWQCAGSHQSCETEIS